MTQTECHRRNNPARRTSGDVWARRRHHQRQRVTERRGRAVFPSTHVRMTKTETEKTSRRGGAAGTRAPGLESRVAIFSQNGGGCPGEGWLLETESKNSPPCSPRASDTRREECDAAKRHGPLFVTPRGLATRLRGEKSAQNVLLPYRFLGPNSENAPGHRGRKKLVLSRIFRQPRPHLTNANRCGKSHDKGVRGQRAANS